MFCSYIPLQLLVFLIWRCFWLLVIKYDRYFLGILHRYCLMLQMSSILYKQSSLNCQWLTVAWENFFGAWKLILLFCIRVYSCNFPQSILAWSGHNRVQEASWLAGMPQIQLLTKKERLHFSRDILHPLMIVSKPSSWDFLEHLYTFNIIPKHVLCWDAQNCVKNRVLSSAHTRLVYTFIIRLVTKLPTNSIHTYSPLIRSNSPFKKSIQCGQRSNSKLQLATIPLFDTFICFCWRSTHLQLQILRTVLIFANSFNTA